MKRFPRNLRVQADGAESIVNMSQAGRDGATAARLRWAGAIPVLAAAARRFPADERLQGSVLAALSACLVGGYDGDAVLSAAAEGADALAIAALGAFSGAKLQYAACSVIGAMASPGGRHAPPRRPLADGAVAAVVGVFRSRADAPSLDDGCREGVALVVSAVALGNLARQFPEYTAQLAEAGVAPLATELLRRRGSHPVLASGLAGIVGSIAKRCPAALGADALAALEAANAIHCKGRGRGWHEDTIAESVQDALDSVRQMSSRSGRRRAGRGPATAAAGGAGAPPATCAHCGAPEKGAAALKVCSRCRRVKYCSQDCLKAAWKVHKRECVPAPGAAEATPPAPAASSGRVGRGAHQPAAEGTPPVAATTAT